MITDFNENENLFVKIYNQIHFHTAHSLHCSLIGWVLHNKLPLYTNYVVKRTYCCDGVHCIMYTMPYSNF